MWAWAVIVLAVLALVQPSQPNKDAAQESLINSTPEATIQTVATNTPSSTTTPEPTAGVKYSTTGTSVADFINRFEAGMQHFGVPCSITDRGYDENGYGMLAVDDLLAMNYTVADDAISDLFLFASGDGSMESGARIMYAIASAMYGLDSTTIATETGDVVVDVLNGATHSGANYMMSGETNDVTGTTVVFSGTMR